MMFERNLESKNNKFNFFDFNKNYRELSESRLDSNGSLDQKRYSPVLVKYSNQFLSGFLDITLTKNMARYALARSEELDEINHNLSVIFRLLKIEKSRGRTDQAKTSENIFCNLLNLIYGYNLKNLNSKEFNYPAIDLGDEGNKIGIQVTITDTNEKVTSTIKKFQAHALHKTYSRIIV